MSAPGENKSPTTASLGRQGRAALRIAGRKTGENRWARAFYRGGEAFLGSVKHVLHALWLEVMGFLFLVMAVIGGGATYREYRHYTAGTTTLSRVVVAAAFTVLFGYFGVESFLRARRKGKDSN